MSHSRTQHIGIFDSGFGGINTLRGIVQALPQYDYMYLGDTARTPYGTRSHDVIYEFTRQAIDFLFANQCDLIILACNTASSDALHKLQQDYIPIRHPGKKVLGVLIPAVEEAATQTINKKIGVIATAGTVQSNAFPREITKINPTIQVFQQACPLLVPLVEADEHHSPAASLIITNYLKPLQKKNIDTLILGCTHYGILEKIIRKHCGAGIHIISATKIVPKKLKDYLLRHPEIESRLGKHKKVTFYSTDLTDTFATLGSKFFGKKITVKRVTLK